MDIYSILGNLVVLGIVGVVLVLFRKSDSSSKSLEQVKRYASKRNEEFDAYVENKIVYLKDLSLSVDVQEKTGKIILDKISEEVDNLSSKIEHIEELNRKVIGYTSTMDKMLNLSKELDDRYGKLKKDASYMETVDKKVKDGRKKLSAIEKNIDEIASEFIKNNNISIHKLRDEIIANTSEQVSELDIKVNKSSIEYEQISNLINDLRDAYNSGAKNSYNSFKDDLNALVEGHREKIVNITAEGESLEEASFSELKDKINHRSNNLTQILDEKLLSIENENDDKISKLSMDMGNIESIANKIKDENEKRLTSIKEQLDSQLLMLKEANSKGVLDLQDEFKVNFSEFKEVSLSEIDKSKKDSEILIQELKKQLETASDYKVEVISKYAETEDYIGSEISDLKDRMDSSVYQIVSDLEAKEETVKQSALKHMDQSMDEYRDVVDKKLEALSVVAETIDSVKNSANERLELTKEVLDSEIQAIKDAFASEKEQIIENIESFRSDIGNKSSENRALVEHESENLKSKIRSIMENQESLIEQLSDSEQEIRGQVLLQKETLLGTISNIASDNVESIEREREHFINKVKDIHDQQESIKKELIDGEQEIRAQVANQRESLLQGLNSDISDQLASLRKDLDNRIESFSSFEEQINCAKDELEDKLSSSNNTLESDYNKFKDNLLGQMREEKQGIKEFIDLFNSEKLKLNTEITGLKEASYSNISDKLDLFEDEYFSKLKEKEELIELETAKWKNDIDTSVSKIRDESINTIAITMDEVNSKVSSFKESLTIDHIKFKDSIETKLVSLVETVEAEKSRLISDKENFKENIEKEMADLEINLSNINDYINTNSRELSETIDRISTEQEKYISESEIFIKADFLREELKTAIDQLTSNIEDVSERSGFVVETNLKLENLKILTETINKQLENVEDKRVKIESLESRVNKVLNLSDSVDEKLTRIKDSESEVSDIQLKLRELKEFQSSVNLEFSRLEQKEAILSETNKAIDSGFGHMEVIEGKLDTLRESLLPFNHQIENIKGKLGRVEEKEIKIDKAINVLSTLDDSILDMEDKIGKIDRARDWIAGVETRLNDTVRTADEQVKLMGALAQNKNNIDNKSNTTAAPDMNKRDMVIKLAHNGWDADAISRTTKLSRGEVELILELSPRK